MEMKSLQIKMKLNSADLTSMDFVEKVWKSATSFIHQIPVDHTWRKGIVTNLFVEKDILKDAFNLIEVTLRETMNVDTSTKIM